MDKISVIERLNQLVQSGGKLKPIELTLNMPKNCLSNYASGKKELPGKWVKPLSDHLENLNKKRVILIDSEDGKFLFMNPDGSTRRCTLVWEDEYKTEQGAPIMKNVTVKEKAIEIFKEITDVPKYDFGDDKYLNIEKYTSYPIKDKPVKKFDAVTWLKQKAAADAEIKSAWEQHKNGHL